MEATVLPKPTLSMKSKTVSSVRFTHATPISSVPPPTLASTVKKPHFPSDLWKMGTQIYSSQFPERCLPPPTEKTDRILRFDSNFESGNLNSAFQISHDIYHLVMEYDKNASGSCQWFYFKITNVRSTAKYTFYLSGFHKNTGVYLSGSKVFWYSDKYAKKTGMLWMRGGSDYAYGITKKEGTKKRSTLHFQISFPYDDDEIYLCYAIPYTYTNLMKSILFWQKSAPNIFRWETLCKSYGGKDCPVLTITSNTSIIPESEKKCIFFTARMHPGESNGSVMMHGVIDFLLGGSTDARFLLDHYIIKCVPMICIDGVIEGFYRISLSGLDENRVWTDPNPLLNPIVFATKELMKSIQREREIVYYIDFHGHSRLHGTFAYGCPNEDDNDLRNKEKVLPKVLAAVNDDFSWGRCVFSIPEGRKSAGRIVVRKELDVVQSFTIESSFGGAAAGPRCGLLYDENRWRMMGASVGKSLAIILSGNESVVLDKKNPRTAKGKKMIKSVSLNTRKGPSLVRSRPSVTFISPTSRVMTSRGVHLF